jgi:hypothetical protein
LFSAQQSFFLKEKKIIKQPCTSSGLVVGQPLADSEDDRRLMRGRLDDDRSLKRGEAAWKKKWQARKRGIVRVAPANLLPVAESEPPGKVAAAVGVPHTAHMASEG